MSKQKLKTNKFLKVTVTYLRHVDNPGNTFMIIFSIVLFSFHNHQNSIIENIAWCQISMSPLEWQVRLHDVKLYAELK